MAEPLAQERLQPSLLDRLVDHAPQDTRESDDKRTLTRQALRQARFGVHFSGRQGKHGKEHRQAEPVEQPRDEHGAQPGGAAAGIPAQQRDDHRNRSPAACGACGGRGGHSVKKEKGGPFRIKTGRVGSASNSSPSRV